MGFSFEEDFESDVLSSRRDILAMGLGISFVIIWFFSVIDIAVITIFTVLKHESVFQSITFGHCL